MGSCSKAWDDESTGDAAVGYLEIAREFGFPIMLAVVALTIAWKKDQQLIKSMTDRLEDSKASAELFVSVTDIIKTTLTSFVTSTETANAGSVKIMLKAVERVEVAMKDMQSRMETAMSELKSKVAEELKEVTEEIRRQP